MDPDLQHGAERAAPNLEFAPKLSGADRDPYEEAGQPGALPSDFPPDTFPSATTATLPPLPASSLPDPASGQRPTVWQPSTLFPAALALSAIVLGLVAGQAPRAAIVASAAAGGLFVLRQRWAAWLVAGMMILSFAVHPLARGSYAGWSLAVLMILAATVPARHIPHLLRLPNWTWALAMVLGAVCIASTAAQPSLLAALATAMGAVCSAYLGAGLAHHFAMTDARLMHWHKRGLMPVTRDLLLGRLTNGMLHHLAQPLNVISMANGNIEYIIENLPSDPASRAQLIERTRKIASHTQGAADILALFRSLGRDTGEAASPQDGATVGQALTRAIDATRFTVKHHVEARLTGDAIDRPVPGRQGTLEILGVAALLGAYAAFVDREGNWRADGRPQSGRRAGTVVLDARLTATHIVIRVMPLDEAEGSLPCQELDQATLWLVEQVAREAGGDFICLPHGSQPTEMILRLPRDDV